MDSAKISNNCLIDVYLFCISSVIVSYKLFKNKNSLNPKNQSTVFTQRGVNRFGS